MPLLDAERVDLLWGADVLPVVVAGIERAGEQIASRCSSWSLSALVHTAPPGSVVE